MVNLKAGIDSSTSGSVCFCNKLLGNQSEDSGLLNAKDFQCCSRVCIIKWRTPPDGGLDSSSVWKQDLHESVLVKYCRR